MHLSNSVPLLQIQVLNRINRKYMPEGLNFISPHRQEEKSSLNDGRM